MGTNFVLGEEVVPLEPLRKHLLIASGIHAESCKADIPEAGDLHSIGLAQLLSGVATKVDFGTVGLIPGANPTAYGQGITVDQYIASKINSPTRFPTLEFGVQTTTDYGVLPLSRMIYSGPNQPVPAEQDPAAMFNRIFTDGTTTGDATAKIAIDQRRSVLDFVADDFRRLQPKLGVSDRKKLDGHLASVRDLETRLRGQTNAKPVTTESCGTLQPVQNAGDPMAKENFPATGKLQMDLLALALKCDMTRIASLQWSWARSNLIHTWAGSSEGHHDMSHAGSTAPLTQVNRWYAEQLAYFGKELLDTEDVDGKSLLENTLVYWASDVAYGYTHTFDNIRAFFLGSGGGTFKTGQRIDLGGQPHQKLLVTFMNMMGVNETSFGDSKYGTGPLTGVLA
jgi:hypothetical protein